jgi:hypothetical protein
LLCFRLGGRRSYRLGRRAAALIARAGDGGIRAGDHRASGRSLGDGALHALDRGAVYRWFEGALHASVVRRSPRLSEAIDRIGGGSSSDSQDGEGGEQRRSLHQQSSRGPRNVD